MSDEIKTTGEGNSGLGIDMVVTIVADKLDTKQVQGNLKETVVPELDKLLTDFTAQNQAVTNLFQNINSVLTAAVAKNSKAGSKFDIQEVQRLTKELTALTSLDLKSQPEEAVLGRQELVAGTLSKLVRHTARLSDAFPKSKKNKAATPLIDTADIERQMTKAVGSWNTASQHLASAIPGLTTVPYSKVEENPSDYNTEARLRTLEAIRTSTAAKLLREDRAAKAEARAVETQIENARIRRNRAASLTAAGVPQVSGMVLDLETANRKNDISSMSFSVSGGESQTFHRDLAAARIKQAEFNKYLSGDQSKLEGKVSLDEMMGKLYEGLLATAGGNKLAPPSLIGHNLPAADFTWLMQNQAKMSPGATKDALGEMLTKMNAHRGSALTDTMDKWVDFIKNDAGEHGIIGRTSGGATLGNIAAALDIPMTAHSVQDDQEATALIARYLSSPEGRAEALKIYNRGGRQRWLNSYRETAAERNRRAMVPEGREQVEFLRYADTPVEDRSLDLNLDYENLITQAESNARIETQEFKKRLDSGLQTGPVKDLKKDPKALQQAYESMHKGTIEAVQKEIRWRLQAAKPHEIATPEALSSTVMGILSDPAIGDLLETMPVAHGVTSKEALADFREKATAKLHDVITTLVDLPDFKDSTRAVRLSGKDEASQRVSSTIEEGGLNGQHKITYSNGQEVYLTDAQLEKVKNARMSSLNAIDDTAKRNLMSLVGSLPEAGIPDTIPDIYSLQYNKKGTLRATFLGGLAAGKPDMDIDNLSKVYREGGYTPDIPEDAALMGNRAERLTIKWLQEHRPELALAFTGEDQRTVTYGPMTGHPDSLGFDTQKRSPFIGEVKYAGDINMDKLLTKGIPPEWLTQLNSYSKALGTDTDIGYKLFPVTMTTDTPEIKKVRADLAASTTSRDKLNNERRLMDLEKDLAERIEAAKQAAKPEELKSGTWKDQFYAIDRIDEIDIKPNKKLQDEIEATIKEITGEKDLQPGGMAAEVVEFYRRFDKSSTDAAQVIKNVRLAGKKTLESLKNLQRNTLQPSGAVDVMQAGLHIDDKKPEGPDDSDGGDGGGGGAGNKPPDPTRANRAKFEKDIEVVEKLRAKAELDLLKNTKKQLLLSNAKEEDRKALEARGITKDRLEEEAKALQAAVTGYGNQRAGLEMHLEEILRTADYTSPAAIEESRAIESYKYNKSETDRIQALKDRALQLAGVNASRPTPASMSEADDVAKELQKAGVQAGHQRLDLLASGVNLKEDIKLPDVTKSLVDADSFTQFRGQGSGIKAQTDLFNKANQAVKALWDQLHKAQGETFIDKSTEGLQSISRIIQEDIVKIDQLADKERRLKEETDRLSALPKEDQDADHGARLAFATDALQAVRDERTALTADAKDLLAQAQKRADKQKPIKDYTNLTTEESMAIDEDYMAQAKEKREQLQMRKAQLEHAIDAGGLTQETYHELGSINDALRRKGVQPYGASNEQLSRMASKHGWDPLAAYSATPGERVGKAFNPEIEVRLATKRALLDLNDLKVELQKQAVSLKVDIETNGLNEDNLKKALENSTQMAMHGLSGSAGYDTAQLLGMGLGQGLSPFGNEIKGDNAFLNQERLTRLREHYSGQTVGGLDYIRIQKANLESSVDSLYAAMSKAGYSEKAYSGYAHVDKLKGLEDDAYKAITDLKNLTDARDKLIKEAEELDKRGVAGADRKLSEADGYTPRISEAERAAASKIGVYDKAVQEERSRFTARNAEMQERIVKDIGREVQEERELLEIEKYRLEYKMQHKQLSLQEAQRLVNMQGDLRRVGLDTTGTEEQVVSQAKKSGFSKMDIQPGRKGNTFVEGAIGLLDWQMQWLSGVAILGSFGFALQNSIGFAKQFEAELRNVQLITQANSYDMELLVGDIGKLTNSYQYSASELGQALVILGQAGFKATESMQLLPGIATLATATMSTLAVAADVTTTAVEAFNVPVEKSGELANSLAAMTIESKLDLEKLGTTFNYVAETASAAGFSVDEIGTAMGLMSNAGVRASTIGTSLRSVIGSLMNPTEKFRAQLADVGISVDEVNPRFHSFGEIMQRLRESGFSVQDAFEGLDKRIAGSIVTLINSSDQWDTFAGKITGTNRAFQMAEGQMDTFEAQSKRLKNNLQLALGGLGAPMLEPLKEGSDVLATMVGLLGKGISMAPGGLWQALGLSVGATSALSIAKAGLGGMWDIGTSIYAKTHGTMGETAEPKRSWKSKLSDAVIGLTGGAHELSAPAPRVASEDFVGPPTRQRSKQRQPLTGMEKTLSTTLTTLFDPGLFMTGAAVTGAYMVGSELIDLVSGEARVREVTEMADRLKTESDQIERQIKLYHDAAYGTTQWADARAKLIKYGLTDPGKGNTWSEGDLKAYSAAARANAEEAEAGILPAQMARANSFWHRATMALKGEEAQNNDAKARAEELMTGLKSEGMAYSTDENYIQEFLKRNKMDEVGVAQQEKIREEFYQMWESNLANKDQPKFRLSEAKSKFMKLAQSRQDDIDRYNKVNLNTAYVEEAFEGESREDFKKRWEARKGAKIAEYTKGMEAQMSDIEKLEGADTDGFTGTQETVNKEIDKWYADKKAKVDRIAQLQALGPKMSAVDKKEVALLKEEVDDLEARAIALSKRQLITTLLPEIARHEASMIVDFATPVARLGHQVGEVSGADFGEYRKKVNALEKQREEALLDSGAAYKEPGAKEFKNLELRRVINLSYDIKERDLNESQIAASVQRIEAHLDKQRAAIRNALNITVAKYSEDFESFKSSRMAAAEMAINKFDLKEGSYLNIPGKYTGSDKTNNLTWLPALSETQREQMKLEAEEAVFKQKLLMQEKSYQDKRNAIVQEYNEKLAVHAKEPGAADEAGKIRLLEIQKKYGDEVSALDKARRDEIRQNIDYEVQQYSRVTKAIQEAHKASEDRVSSMDKLILKLDKVAGKRDNTKPPTTDESISNDITRLGHEMLEAQRVGDTSKVSKLWEEIQAKGEEASTRGARASELASTSIQQLRNRSRDADIEYKTKRTASELEPMDDRVSRWKAQLEADDRARRGWTDKNDYSMMVEGKKVSLKNMPSQTPADSLPKPLLTDAERKDIERKIAEIEGTRGAQELDASKTMNEAAPETMTTVYEQVSEHAGQLVTDFVNLGAAIQGATERLEKIAQQNEAAKKESDERARDRANGNTETSKALDKRTIGIQVEPSPMFITTVIEKTSDKIQKHMFGLNP